MAALESKDIKDLDMIFEEYQAERHPIAKETFIRSQAFGKILGKNLQAKVIRTLVKHTPPWMQRKINTKATETRSQVSFLPLVEDRGSVKPIYQLSLKDVGNS